VPARGGIQRAFLKHGMHNLSGDEHPAATELRCRQTAALGKVLNLTFAAMQQ